MFLVLLTCGVPLIQVPIKNRDKLYTTFEAGGGLYQFTRVPFVATNEVACFKRTMDFFIKEKQLPATFAYLDNITICRMTQEEHNFNLNRFLKDAKEKKYVTMNRNVLFQQKRLNILSYVVEREEY